MTDQIIIGKNKINILSSLGQGTYGTVYLIDNKKANYQAIKIITTQSEDGIKSLREIDIMSKLSHPNLIHSEGTIVGVNDAVTLGIIMPLATTDLNKIIKSYSFNLNQRLNVLRDITSGLNFLHKSGYLHLDLKPLNILLFNNSDNISSGYMAKLTDFGLSLFMSNSHEVSYPLELQTVTYRAPEILLNSNGHYTSGIFKGHYKYTIKTDIWSLGIIFLEVLSYGTPLYPEPTKIKIKNVIKKYLDPSAINYTLDAYLVNLPSNIKKLAIDLIKRMLSFDPNLRPTTTDILNILSEHKNEGIIIYKYPLPPRKCDIINYYGFDFLVRLATQIKLLKTETFFLAADLYQRALAFAHALTGNTDKDYANIALIAATSFYMAIKLLEPFYLKPLEIVKLSGNLFLAKDIIKSEASLVQLFEGILYPQNIYTAAKDMDRLYQGFELLRNCHVYHKINLNKWIEMQAPGTKTNILFNEFLSKTKYYQIIITPGNVPNIYIPILYKQDTN